MTHDKRNGTFDPFAAMNIATGEVLTGFQKGARLRRGRFTSVADVTEAITTRADQWNTDPKPSVWKATAEDTIAKVQRGRDTLHQIKSATDH